MTTNQSEWIKRSITIAILMVSVLLMIEFRGINLVKAPEASYTTYEYDEGNLHFVEYYDKKGNLVVHPGNGYAGRVMTVDDQGRMVLERYYDENREFIPRTHDDEETYWMVAIEYIKDDPNNKPSNERLEEIYQTMENVDIIRYRYLDKHGKQAADEYGNAYTERCTVNGTLYELYYFLKDGTPGKGQCAQNGSRWADFDEEGRTIDYFYLDADGNPMMSEHGCAEVRKVYEKGSYCDFYFDTEGNPTKLIQGEYGARFIGEKTIYLNADGSTMFIPNVFLLNHAWLVVLGGFGIALFGCLLPKKLRMLYLGCYVLGILYFTLFNRVRIGYRIAISGFQSYEDFWYSVRVRIQVICNVWLFIPIGAVSYSLFSKSHHTGTLNRQNILPIVLLLLFPTIIEILQYYLCLGQFDIADIINNCSGSLIGYYLGSRIVEWMEHGFLGRVRTSIYTYKRQTGAK